MAFPGDVILVMLLCTFGIWFLLSVAFCGAAALKGPDPRFDQDNTKLAKLIGFIAGGAATIAVAGLPLLFENPTGVLVSPFIGGLLSYKVSQRLALEWQDRSAGFSLRTIFIVVTAIVLFVAAASTAYRYSG